MFGVESLATIPGANLGKSPRLSLFLILGNLSAIFQVLGLFLEGCEALPYLRAASLQGSDGLGEPPSLRKGSPPPLFWDFQI